MVPTLIQRTDKGTYYGYDALTSKKGETLFQNFKVNLENPAYKKEHIEFIPVGDKILPWNLY